MTNTTPNPCPFCGSETTLVISAYRGPEWSSYVECSECGARGPIEYHAQAQRLEAKERAIELWNGRTNVPA